MANGTPSDADDCIIRSGVRSGLKREFAFALKSQAQLSPSLGRTRSGKPSLPPSPNSNPNTSSSVAKRFKKPSPLNPVASSLSLVETPAPAAAAVADFGSGPKLKEDDALARPMEEDEPEPIVENPLSFAAVPEDAHGSSGADTASALKVTAQSTLEEASLPRLLLLTEDKDGPKEDSGGSIIDIDVDSCTLENSATTPPHLVQVIGDSVETPVKMEKFIMETPPRRLTRSLLKGAINEKEEPQLETADPDTGDLGLPENPASRRFTRSLLKVPGEETSAGEVSANVSSCSVGPDEAKGGVSVDDGLSSISPSKKLELKMSKKIALNKLPMNVRELLGTGLLEGLPVMYLFSANKPFGLQGVIKGNGILCACSLCKGSKVVSAYNFEVHAGSTKKHPSDYIFLENGKSLRDVMRACTSAPLDMLESAIQNAIGVVPPTKSFTCLKCKELFHSPHSGKFAMMCDSCLEPKHNQKTMTSFRGTPSNAKLPSRDLAGDASYELSKKITSQKNSILPTKGLTEDASDSLSKNSSTQKKLGKLTRKDLGLHKLVFMDDILPEGTEVGYYVRGKRLLDGYIKDSGIYCHCCGSVVSPSQFEAHAGRAARRKPYNNIYTSNGVSLHELSVSLSKGRKLTASENDDLCSICADGGDLLLCDQCPRAFHKECVGLSSIPGGDWYCRYCLDMHQRERSLSSNDNAIAAGRVAGVDPIEQIIKRCIRIVTTSTDIGGCVLCRCHDFSKSGFDNRTVIICDQCEKEYHVGCLKDHNMCDLKELPEGEWFCSSDCVRIHSALQQLLQESQPLQGVHADIIKKKREEKGLDKDGEIIIRWRLLSGRTSPAEVKLLLSEAVTIFHESFDPIIDAVTGRDLIPSMVYGRNVRDQDFGGMYCAVLTVNSSVVSAGILRVLGCEVAELPLVATNMESQGLGYFQSLFACMEELLQSLKVKHFVLPSADESKSIWTKKFGFSTITRDQLQEYTKGARPMVFQGTSMLYKPVVTQGSR